MWWFSTIQSCFIDIPLTTSPPLIIISGSVPCPIPSKEPAQAEIFVIRPWMNILSWWMRRDAQKPDTFIVDVLTPVCDQTNQSWLDSVPSCISCLRVHSTMGCTGSESHFSTNPVFVPFFLPFSIIDFTRTYYTSFYSFITKKQGSKTQNVYKTLCDMQPDICYVRLHYWTCALFSNVKKFDECDCDNDC